MESATEQTIKAHMNGHYEIVFKNDSLFLVVYDLKEYEKDYQDTPMAATELEYWLFCPFCADLFLGTRDNFGNDNEDAYTIGCQCGASFHIINKNKFCIKFDGNLEYFKSDLKKIDWSYMLEKISKATNITR